MDLIRGIEYADFTTTLSHTSLFKKEEKALAHSTSGSGSYKTAKSRMNELLR